MDFEGESYPNYNIFSSYGKQLKMRKKILNSAQQELFNKQEVIFAAVLCSSVFSPKCSKCTCRGFIHRNNNTKCYFKNLLI